MAVEADSTMVHRWKKKAEHHEVYLGIAYDGKPKVRSPCGSACPCGPGRRSAGIAGG
ncbi:MAG: hypothetical protein ACYTKD_04970 [Planctomycetota bacterium]